MHLLLYSEPSSATGAGRWRWILFPALIALAALLIARTVFFVDESQYVYVTQFGEPIRFFSRPGLQWKWPYQSLRRFDRRLQIFEPAARELLTQDKENLNFAWYVCWRLPGVKFADDHSGDPSQSAQPSFGQLIFQDPDSADSQIEQYVRRFMQSAGTLQAMENRLEERVQAAMAAEIGRLRFEQLASLDEKQLQFEQLAQRVTQQVSQNVADQFGVELVDVRLKRVSYPEAVKPAVFAEIRSERERVAVQFRAEGASQKAKIQSLADLQRDQLLARAKQEALTIRGEGEAAAIEISNLAHNKDPKFYELLKTLETYRTILDNQTTVVLSADAPLLKLLTQGVPEPTAVQQKNSSESESEMENPPQKSKPAATAAAASSDPSLDSTEGDP
jgi:membrane protease subunit HflC